MSRIPSFLDLFHGSRYSRSEITESNPSSRDRKELFVASSVAFVLKHDAAFRRFFLKNICGIAETELDDGYTIEVEPKKHADLRIWNSSRTSVYIVEFKLNAKLEPHQALALTRMDPPVLRRSDPVR